MTNPEIEEWLNTFQGIPMNPDKHYGLQCVDLANQYAMDIFGIKPRVAMTAVVGARQLLDAASDDYFVRINDAEGIYPQRGDIVVFNGSAINQWGHVCVCLEAHPNGMWVAQQDGFAPPLAWADGNWYSNKPAHKAWLAYNSKGTGPVSGWLRPRENKIVGYKAPAPVQAPVAANQRVTGPTGVTRRSEPRVADNNVVDKFGGDLILTLGGFIRGQELTIGGLTSNVWFKGGLSGGYMWAGGFTSQSTDGLEDLTPAPAPAPAPAGNVRITGTDGVRRRATADKAGALIDAFDADREITLAGFVRATDPYGDGNNVWFVGGLSGGYMWSGSFTNSSPEGLKDLTPAGPAPTPAPVIVYDFVADFDFVEKIPAHLTNVQRAVDNPGIVVFPAQPEYRVIHQMGTPGVDTIGSSINEFKREGAFKSAHFLVSGKRIVQMVSLKDRAYHAGAAGNGWVGIETDPYQDADTIASVRKLLRALDEYFKNQGKLIRHKDVPGNATSCGSLIDLSRYELEPPVVVVPDPEPAPTPPASNDADVLRRFFEWLIQMFTAFQKKK
jgi:hypothetical protein